MRPAALTVVIASVAFAFGSPAPAAGPAPRGRVALDGHVLRDDSGPFLGMGVSYFPALRRAKFEPDRFRSDLKFLHASGFNYVRVFSMVGWYPAWRGREIAPVAFRNKAGEPIDAWDDYRARLAEAIDVAFDEFGIRTQLTIFADAQLIPAKADRIAHLDVVLATIKGREHKVILLEVANEAWQNGFEGDAGIAELREYAKYLADRTDVLVAISATPEMTNESLKQMYVGSAADIATEHFARDRRTVERDWLPVRDVFRVNAIDGLPPASHNEPIGPGSSVAEQREPTKIVVAAAYAWMSGLPMHVYHPSAGIFGDGRFEEMPGVGDFREIVRLLPPDVCNWRRTEGADEVAPFITYCDGRANTPWTDVPGAKTGALRNLSCVKGDDFYTLPIGILSGGVELEAGRRMTIDVFHPVSGELVRKSIRLGARERVALPQGPGAYLIRGRYAAAE